MEFKDFFKLFQISAKNYLKNPVLIIPSLTILIIQIILFPLIYKVNSNLINQSNLIHTIWFAFLALLSLFLVSFFISILICLSFEVNRDSLKLRHFFKGAKFTFKSFAIILVILAVYNIILFVIGGISFYLGRILSFSILYAKMLFFLLYMLSMLAILIFFAFSSFILISDNLSIVKSIKSSFRFVKLNYISILSILIIFFVIDWLISLLNAISFASILSIGELINFIIIYPLLALVLSEFYSSSKSQK